MLPLLTHQRQVWLPESHRFGLQHGVLASQCPFCPAQVWHKPPMHDRPLQQVCEEVHALPFEPHWQVPLTQFWLQQSEFA